MLHIVTKQRTGRAVVWNGTAGAAAELAALDTGHIALHKTGDGWAAFVEINGEPQPLIEGEVFVLGNDGTAGVFTRAQLEDAFEVLAVPDARGVAA